MESPEMTVRQRTTGQDENQTSNQEKLASSKPLHRFIRRDPRSHGVVLIIFGCAEVLMGFQLASDEIPASVEIYIPFWQGALFLACGFLSIYTALHPSKKMVTICMAMYVVSLLGIIVSICYRIYSISHLVFLGHRFIYSNERIVAKELLCIEAILFTSSLCVSGLLIFLSTIARLALKSTRSQIIVQCVPAPPPPPPQSDTTAN